ASGRRPGRVPPSPAGARVVHDPAAWSSSGQSPGQSGSGSPGASSPGQPSSGSLGASSPAEPGDSGGIGGSPPVGVRGHQLGARATPRVSRPGLRGGYTTH